ncbi:hypothetical protein Misp05_01060 [Micromonospora sp. NBRC 107095]|nr:hypothetical protein Misp05_01060 [Micromonospora sp. NBRC 107095]
MTDTGPPSTAPDPIPALPLGYDTSVRPGRSIGGHRRRSRANHTDPEVRDSTTPVDEPRDNLWIPVDSMCAACAQPVENHWGILGQTSLTCGDMLPSLWRRIFRSGL